MIDLQTADSQFAAMYLGFASKELDQNQITDYLTRVVQPKLSAVSGVQRADILGARVFAMRVWLKPEKMAALGISPSQVRDLLGNNNYLSALGSHEGLDGVREPRRQHEPADGRGVQEARRQGGQGQRRPALRDRGRRAGRRGLQPGSPLQRPDGDVHGDLGPSDGQLARRRQARSRGDEAGRRRSCPPA